MTLLSIAELLLLATLTAAGHHNVYPRDVCSASPWSLSTDWQPELEYLGIRSQLPLGNVPGNHVPSPSGWFVSDCHSEANGTETFCTYSSHSFADGRGISIVTKPERIEAVQKLPAFWEKGSLDGVNTQPSPPFIEKEMPGKGRGLIATRALQRGDRIFAHTPLLVLDDDAFEDLDNQSWLKLEKAAVHGLPSRSRDLFWELMGHAGVDPISDRIDTNAFEVDIEGTVHYVVFPEIARINHDCRPNAAYFFDEDTLTHYVHAITTIHPGTEITITYTDPHQLQKRRMKKLFSTWGFHCSCSLCTLHPTLARDSDARLLQIENMSDRLEDWETATSDIALALISLYEQERLYAPMSDAYRYAALTFCAEGNRWSAIRYARLAVHMGMLNDGFDDEDVAAMKLLAANPEGQSCWAIRLM